MEVSFQIEEFQNPYFLKNDGRWLAVIPTGRKKLQPSWKSIKCSFQHRCVGILHERVRNFYSYGPDTSGH